VTIDSTREFYINNECMCKYICVYYYITARRVPNFLRLPRVFIQRRKKRTPHSRARGKPPTTRQADKKRDRDFGVAWARELREGSVVVMVLLVLYVKATLENVSKIAFPTSLPFQLSIKDPVGYDERASVTVDPQNINELENSRGEAHFVVKFEGQMKQSSIVIVDEVKNVLKKDASITEEDDGAFVPIRGFECRGVDITGWDKCSEESGSGVTVVSKAGTVFEDVHLDEDWYEYCEKGGEAVSATDVEFDFRIEKSGK